MFQPTDFLIAGCLLLGAALYTSVGHAGASAYIAILSVFGVPVATIKPTALALNILVSSYTSWQYIRKKLCDFQLLLPLVVGAIPAAFIGGYIELPMRIYKLVVGVILIISGLRFLATVRLTEKPPQRPHFLLAVGTGAVIGLLAGLTGTGGGIFLSPLALFLGWTSTKGASGTASAFILANSVSGLLGNYASILSLPPTLPLFAVAVAIGAFVGTKIGLQYLSHVGIKRVLGIVLLIAGGKLAFDL